MEKLALKRVFINPKEGYSVVDETNPTFYMDDQDNGYLKGENKNVTVLIKTYMVEGATKPVWFKKLKELGINITSETKELEVEFVNGNEYSYKQSIDGKYVNVPSEEVLTSEKSGEFALVGGVIKKLYKRNVKKYTISGVDVGNEYYYLKILGFEQPKKA